MSQDDALTVLRRRIQVAEHRAAPGGAYPQITIPTQELLRALELAAQQPPAPALAAVAPSATPGGAPAERWHSPLHRTYIHDPDARRAPAVNARLAQLKPAERELAIRMEEDRGRASLLALVKGECRRLDLLAQHFKNPMQSTTGFPDLHILGTGQGRLMYRELKKERGRCSDDQVAYLTRLNTCGLDADVWRPSDWYTQRIQRELAALAEVEFVSWW